MISQKEQQRRQEAADFAHASVFLSGFKPSAECVFDAQRFVRGEITFDEFVFRPASPIQDVQDVHNVTKPDII